ncbi:MAG: adenylosuccinate lyase [Arsenophonus sp.]|nr:MAG: adenylosuccinate lyase [Arsenophonus sp.]
MEMKFIALSPIDGRYHDDVISLRSIFSEFSYFRFRIKIEIFWLKWLSNCLQIKEIEKFSEIENKLLDDIIINFNQDDFRRIKEIEKKINHDTKSIEFFLKEKIQLIPNLKINCEFIHFACTSEDINNLAYSLMLKKCRKQVLIIYWKKIIDQIKKMAYQYQYIPLLSKTHGQPASSSTLGKEFANFVFRMYRQYKQLKNVEILGKFNGAVGNYNAHYAAYPNIDWNILCKKFVMSFGLKWNPYTTQIEPHDYISELFHCISRFNTILINFNQDIWGYISCDYFIQKCTKNEIGSSTMPHKINPIYFENSEGNLGLANSFLIYMANKLPISRWQRDLTDSTILRNIGVSMGYCLIAYKSLLKGLKKITVNKKSIYNALNVNWQVLAEPIQTVMRRYSIDGSYEKLRYFSQGKKITRKKIMKFIDSLQLPKYEKARLKKITPFNYIGYASEMVKFIKNK